MRATEKNFLKGVDRSVLDFYKARKPYYDNNPFFEGNRKDLFLISNSMQALLNGLFFLKKRVFMRMIMRFLRKN